MKNKIFSTLLVVSLMMAIGSAFAQESPVTIEGAKTINASQAKALFDDGVIFVDVRSDKDWGAGRIPDAVHIELKKVFSEQALSQEAQKDEPIVFYCNGVSCLRSSDASAKALSWGFTNVYYYRLGFPSWKAANYPTE